MTELIADVDPGTLPPRTRKIFSEVGRAIEQGWKPIELAQKLGVAPSFLSELIGELRTALGFVNGVFPTLSTDEYRTLLESVAAQGVVSPLTVDEHGVIDGHARVRVLDELEHICGLADAYDDWAQIAEHAAGDRAHAVEVYGRAVVEAALYLAGLGGELVELVLEHRWTDPPVRTLRGLSPAERREHAITLNAHRRHLHRGDLRLLVEVELMRDNERSNVAIARLVGCTHQWVAQIRADIVEEERLLANPQAGPEVQVLEPWRPVTQLDCPHCAHHLALERAGRDFRLELTA